MSTNHYADRQPMLTTPATTPLATQPLQLRIAAVVAGMMVTALMAFAAACGSDAGSVIPTDEANPAPDFDLPNANAGSNKNIALSQYQDDKNVVLVFYRAYW